MALAFLLAQGIIPPEPSAPTLKRNRVEGALGDVTNTTTKRPKIEGKKEIKQIMVGFPSSLVVSSDKLRLDYLGSTA